MAGYGTLTPVQDVTLSELPPPAAGSGAEAPPEFDRPGHPPKPRPGTGAPAQGGGTTASAPAPPATGASFAGLVSADNGQTVTPPDPHGAMGPNNYVEIVNISIRVFSRTGKVLGTASLNSFFGRAPGSASPFDPQILYDDLSGRWFASAVALDNPTTGPAHLFVAVSLTDDPMGTWSVYHADLASDFQDFPGLGVSDDKVTISYNRFVISSGNFVGAQTLVVQKSDLLAHVAAPQAAFLPAAGGDITKFTLRPVQSLTSTTTQFLVSSGIGDQNGTSTTLEVYSVTGTPAVHNVVQTETTATISPLTIPPDAQQKGSADLLSTNDNRLLGASWRNGRLWTTATSGCNGGFSCAAFIEYDTGSNSVLQDFQVGAAGEFYFYPAVRADPADNAMAVFSRSSTAIFAEVDGALRLAGDAPNTMRPAFTIKAGEAASTNIFCTLVAGATRCRWGDYFGASVDPRDPGLIWLVGEYGKTDGFANWGTWIGNLAVDTDGDGYSDVLESSMGKNPATFCAVMRADVNTDGVVNLLDLAAAAVQFGQPVPPGYGRLDQNADNVINLLDLAKMAASFGSAVTSCP